MASEPVGLLDNSVTSPPMFYLEDLYFTSPASTDNRAFYLPPRRMDASEDTCETFEFPHAVDQASCSMDVMPYDHQFHSNAFLPFEFYPSRQEVNPWPPHEPNCDRELISFLDNHPIVPNQSSTDPECAYPCLNTMTSSYRSGASPHMDPKNIFDQGPVSPLRDDPFRRIFNRPLSPIYKSKTESVCSVPETVPSPGNCESDVSDASNSYLSDDGSEVSLSTESSSFSEPAICHRKRRKADLPSMRIESTEESMSNQVMLVPQHEVRLKTKIDGPYWKNGRKNVQCFPTCGERKDFFSMKMNGEKHRNGGVCRQGIYCTTYQPINEEPRAKDECNPVKGRKSRMTRNSGSIPSGRQNSSPRVEYVLAGRFERVSQLQGEHPGDKLSAPPTFESMKDYNSFAKGCVFGNEIDDDQVVMDRREADGNAENDGEVRERRNWFFYPDVWKVHPMLKKKRKPTKSIPGQMYPFCFRIYFLRHTRWTDKSTVECLASASSSFFELVSTRTLDRVKHRSQEPTAKRRRR